MTYPYTSGQIVTANDLNSGGLHLITPSGVTGGTLSGATVNVGSGVAAVIAFDVFSSDFDNYLVSFAGISVSAATAFNVSLADNSGSVTNGWYGNTFYTGTGASTVLTNYNYSNSSHSECCSARNGELNSGSVNIYSPFLASYTRQNFISADSIYFRMGAGIHQSATSYPHLVFNSGAADMTGGTLRVYGYSKG